MLEESAQLVRGADYDERRIMLKQNSEIQKHNFKVYMEKVEMHEKMKIEVGDEHERICAQLALYTKVRVNTQL